jgi:pyruvate/2-oxoglutarate dehydrogenase complex dihydrolipoamide dehydrogenase (E3) component
MRKYDIIIIGSGCGMNVVSTRYRQVCISTPLFLS